MNILQQLEGVNRLFLDTGPVIYYVEKNEHYLDRVQPVFELVDDGLLTVVTSPVTLAECLVHPYRLGLAELVQSFLDLIVAGENTGFVPLTMSPPSNPLDCELGTTSLWQTHSK